MSVVSVLKLDDWMEIYQGEENLKSCKPVYNRDGYYYNRITDRCWFEVNNRAYLVKNNAFKFEMQLLNTPRLSIAERNAIKILMKNKLASKELHMIMYHNDLLDEERNISYRTRVVKKCLIGQ